MKYQKPISQEISSHPVAEGECNSGTIPTERCFTGYTNVGSCTRGFTAGQTCNQGDAANLPTGCNPGTVVTHCVAGFVAGLE